MLESLPFLAEELTERPSNQNLRRGGPEARPPAIPPPASLEVDQGIQPEGQILEVSPGRGSYTQL